MTRAPRGYPDLVSTAKNADFFFEDLPQVDSDDDEEEYYWDKWRLRGCAGGRLLLSRGRGGLILTVYEPIARTAVFLHPEGVFRYSTHMVRYAIVVNEADGSFLVMGVVDFMAAVFSSRSGKWVKFEDDAFHKTSRRSMYDDWDWYDDDEDIVNSSDHLPGNRMGTGHRYEE